MTTAIGNPTASAKTRRWPRYPAQLPVLISVKNDASEVAVPGLASEISRSGMALYGGVPLQPGDVMEVEFQTSGKPRVAGVVRNRSGFCFGLEFLNLIGSSGAAHAGALRVGDLLGVLAHRAEAYLSDEQDLPWRIWLTERRGDIAIAISAFVLLFALWGWTSRPHQLAQAKTPSQPSLTLYERMLIGFGMAEAPPVPTPMGNPNVQVWEDLHTALYYCPGADLYGKTPGGKLATQRDAQLDQFEPAARKSCE